MHELLQALNKYKWLREKEDSLAIYPNQLIGIILVVINIYKYDMAHVMGMICIEGLGFTTAIESLVTMCND